MACQVVIETVAKSVANWNVLSSFILEFFQVSRQPRRIRKSETTVSFVDAGLSLLK